MYVHAALISYRSFDSRPARDVNGSCLHRWLFFYLATSLPTSTDVEGPKVYLQVRYDWNGLIDFRDVYQLVKSGLDSVGALLSEFVQRVTERRYNRLHRGFEKIDAPVGIVGGTGPFLHPSVENGWIEDRIIFERLNVICFSLLA